MSEFLRKVLGQVRDFFVGLSPVKKIAAGVTATVLVVGTVFLVKWAGDTTFHNLMNNLGPEDAANVIRVLREKHIPFTVDPTGKNIAVPPEQIYQLRLELATLGLPQASVVGYEVFDKQNLGTTSFVQKVNQKRAIEGELIRTINTIRGVKRSRVHLAMPTKSTFAEDQKKSTASVVLDLDAGVVLNEKQIYGIGNLVARAVEGMEINDVVIVDSSGKVLSRNISDPLAAAAANQIELTRKVEEEMEKRVEGILARIVGEGKVVAKVTAELEFAQVSETATTYDAEGTAVRSVGKNNHLLEGVRPGPQGVPGALSNTPPGQYGAAGAAGTGGTGGGGPVGAAGAAGGVATDRAPGASGAGLPALPGEIRSLTRKDNETVNYEVPGRVTRKVSPTGTIKKLSVAVVVDGKTVKTTDKDGKVQAKTEAWEPDKLKEFETVVATAVGVDKKRGDLLEVKNLEFTHEDFETAQKVLQEAERKTYTRSVIVYALIGLAIMLFFFFVVRPFVKWVTENTIDSVDTFLPQTIEELERLQKNATLPGMEEIIPVVPENIDPEKVEGNMLREKIVTLVDQNPYKAALILQEWLHKAKEGEEKKDGKKPAAGGGGGGGTGAGAAKGKTA